MYPRPSDPVPACLPRKSSAQVFQKISTKIFIEAQFAIAKKVKTNCLSKRKDKVNPNLLMRASLHCRELVYIAVKTNELDLHV